MVSKSFKRILSILAVVLSVNFAVNVRAEETMMNMEKGKDGMMMDEAMMAKMKEYSTPNENHRALDQIVGDWTYAMKWWMAPDGTPEESQGTSSNAWTLDGHFVEIRAKGMAMGQPFEGLGYQGHDNLKKEFVSIWMDNMGTGIMTATAKYDPVTKTFTESGKFSCPMTDGGERSYRGLIKIIDADTYVYETYMTDPASNMEFKSMEITYKRSK